MKTKLGLPPALESEVLAKAAENFSVRQIAAWLETTHGVKVGSATIARFLAKRRTERADVAKVVVREQLGKSLNLDLDRLEKIRAELQRRAEASDATSEFAKLTELEIKVLDRKLHYSGAGEPDQPDPKLIGGVRIYLPPEDNGSGGE